MNFLMLRSNQTAAASEQQQQQQPASAQELQPQANVAIKSATTLEGLVSEDPFPVTPSSSDGDRERSGRFGRGSGGGSNAKSISTTSESHTDVTEDEGWVTIPYSNSFFFFRLLVCLHC